MLQFTSKHDALVSLEDGVANGRYNNCSHLLIAIIEPPFGQPFFQHDCTEHSFVEVSAVNKAPIIKCPENCKLFRDRKSARNEQIRKRILNGIVTVITFPFKAVLEAVKWILEWFGKLSAPVQVLILLIIVFIFFPKATEAVISLYKLFKGLWYNSKGLEGTVREGTAPEDNPFFLNAFSALISERRQVELKHTYSRLWFFLYVCRCLNIWHGLGVVALFYIASTGEV